MTETIFNLKQSEDNNCGAYALLAVAKTFGVLPPENDINLSHDGRESIIKVEQSLQEMAGSIYRITGNLNPVGGYLKKNESGYNSLSALSYVAKQLSFNTSLCGIREAVVGFGQRYKDELNRCKMETKTVNENASYYIKPNTDEANLLCVTDANSLFLHWIVQIYGLNYYDPKDGNWYQWKDPKVCRDSVGPYRWAGIWMNLRKDE